jgi:hypothetical protein
VEVEAPGLALTAFDCAQAFQSSLAYNPSSSNRMTPFGNKFLFGSTPYPKKGNAALLQTLRTANINYVGTGGEGGIGTAALIGGKMLDGNDFTYRYCIGYTKINGDLVLANEVINGPNNSANPLWYDQNGIARLQASRTTSQRGSFTRLKGIGCAASSSCHASKACRIDRRPQQMHMVVTGWGGRTTLTSAPPQSVAVKQWLRRNLDSSAMSTRRCAKRSLSRASCSNYLLGHGASPCA